MTDNETASIKSFLAGGVGGACSVILGHPFDTIKVHLQTMKNPKPGQIATYKGTVDCVFKIFKSEGTHGFYKGMASPLFAATPIYAAFFFGYNIGRKLQINNDNQVFIAGMISGLFSTVIVAPVERIKCVLQAQGVSQKSKKYYGPVDVARKLYRNGGIRSIYRGTAATLLRDIPSSGAYFMVYEWLQEALTPENANQTKLSVSRTLLAGGLAGVLSNWFVCIPPDTMKSRLQSEYVLYKKDYPYYFQKDKAPEERYPNGIRSVFKEMIKHEGVLSFYRGYLPILLRAFPANSFPGGGWYSGLSGELKFEDEAHRILEFHQE